MKKTFQKNLVAAAVAMVASVGVQASEVGQMNLLFPYVTTASTAFTFLTITNRGATTLSDNKASNMAVTIPLNFKYGVKDVAAANSAPCIHADNTMGQTANDVMTFEVADKVNMFAALGEGTTPTTATSSYFPYQIQNRHGFLVVNGDGATAGVKLFGEATIVDTASGMATTYNARGHNTTNNSNPDFTIDDVGVAGGVEVASDGLIAGHVRAHGRNVVTWMADAIVSTSWFVVPLGKANTMTPSGGGGITAGYSMWADGQRQTGAYDMNEGFHSGGGRTDVRCVGTINRSLMLSEIAYLNTRSGGTANLVFFNSATTNDGTATIEGSPAGGVAAATASAVNVVLGLADTAGGAAAVGTTAHAHKSLAYKILSSTALGATKTTVSREAHY